MSRRRSPPEEVQFGSDSFLDVVANIVGILIILIVITGLRISENPKAFPTITQSDSAEPDNSEGTNLLPPTSSMPELVETPDAADATETPKVVVLEPADEPEPEPEEQHPPLPELTVPQELVLLTDRLEVEIAELKKLEAEFGDRLKQSDQKQSSLLERQQAVQEMMKERMRDLKGAKKKAAKADADLDLAKETLIRLTKKLEEVESTPANISSLEHRITPISKEVNGKEKHYRLEKNRVIEVPLDELMGQLREQIARRRDWLIKTRQHQGQIGPLNGFSMFYVVRVDALSDSPRQAAYGFQLSLAGCEIRPEPDTKGETEAIALRKGSMFYQSILGTSPETTLTFWVYPDSYAIYRTLQKFAHEHGFSVAGRPMPAGQHIGVSPDGTKSNSE